MYPLVENQRFIQPSNISDWLKILTTLVSEMKGEEWDNNTILSMKRMGQILLSGSNSNIMPILPISDFSKSANKGINFKIRSDIKINSVDVYVESPCTIDVIIDSFLSDDRKTIYKKTFEIKSAGVNTIQLDAFIPFEEGRTFYIYIPKLTSHFKKVTNTGESIFLENSNEYITFLANANPIDSEELADTNWYWFYNWNIIAYTDSIQKVTDRMDRRPAFILNANEPFIPEEKDNIIWGKDLGEEDDFPESDTTTSLYSGLVILNASFGDTTFIKYEELAELVRMGLIPGTIDSATNEIIIGEASFTDDTPIKLELIEDAIVSEV